MGGTECRTPWGRVARHCAGHHLFPGGCGLLLQACKGDSLHPRLIAPLPLRQLALPSPVPMQLGLLLVFLLFSLLLLLLPPPSLSATWSQPLVIDGFHHRLLLLRFIFRHCLLVRAPFNLPDLPVFDVCPPAPFPCLSQVSQAITLRAALLSGCCKGVFLSSVFANLLLCFKIPPCRGRLLFAFSSPPAPFALPEVHFSILSHVSATAPKNISRAP